MPGINTNISAYYAQQNIGKASTAASLSVSRLSSGNRIVRASDDVASLAAGTSLRTAVTTLRMSMVNTSQGASMLQVADGALSQITDILQRQKAIAIQAGAGSMGAQERSFLNQEFQQLTSEIDRLTTTTNFNGVTLLDGSVFDKVTPTTATNNAQAASLTIAFNSSLAGGKTLIFNGVTYASTTTAAAATGTFFFSGDVNGMVDSLVQLLNASTNNATNTATYSRSGNSLVITADAGNTTGRTYSFDIGTTPLTIAGVSVSGILSSGTATRFTMQGGTDVGLGFGRTTASGSVGDTIITGQNQLKANQQITVPPTLPAAVTALFSGKAITFNDPAGNISFNFLTAGALTAGNGDATQILIGSTLEETMDNAVQTLRSYVGSALLTPALQPANTPNTDRRFWFEQFEFTREGRQINIERKALGNVQTSGGGLVQVSTSMASASPPTATPGGFNNGSVTGGVSTNGIQNKDWIGVVKGFKATYANNVNQVNLALTVGGQTYNAFNVNTLPTAGNVTVRFSSTDGGYFEVEMANNQGVAVTDQSTADTVAARFDAAFAGLTFFQKRDVTSYSGAGAILTNGVATGSLTGTSVRLQNSNFTDLAVQDIKVTAPASGTSNGIIEMTIGGETYRSGDIGSYIRPNARIQLTSLSNANNIVEFYGPAVTEENPQNTSTLPIDFSNSDKAKSFEAALKTAFGFDSGGAALKFQVGTTTEDTLSVTIGSAKTEKLYDGATIDVLTQTSAASASDVIDAAINKVTSIRADVGASQSRFNYASNNIESALQNQDAARGLLLDTDIASESTAYATAQVQLQAGISVLAQANQLPQNLLKLIG